MIPGLTGTRADADEPPDDQDLLLPGFGSSFNIGEVLAAANNLRMAAEAFERFGQTFSAAGPEVADSISRIGGEFDPLGYKTAFRTIAMQTEIIQEQQRMIFELQRQEIKRLRSENRRLRKSRGSLRE